MRFVRPQPNRGFVPEVASGGPTSGKPERGERRKRRGHFPGPARQLTSQAWERASLWAASRGHTFTPFGQPAAVRRTAEFYLRRRTACAYEKSNLSRVWHGELVSHDDSFRRWPRADSAAEARAFLLVAFREIPCGPLRGLWLYAFLRGGSGAQETAAGERVGADLNRRPSASAPSFPR